MPIRKRPPAPDQEAAPRPAGRKARSGATVAAAVEAEGKPAGKPAGPGAPAKGPAPEKASARKQAPKSPDPARAAPETPSPEDPAVPAPRRTASPHPAARAPAFTDSTLIQDPRDGTAKASAGRSAPAAPSSPTGRPGATVLFAWEIGDGLGHVMRLLPVARRLREEGCECVFAIRDLATVNQVRELGRFPVFQAPVVNVAEWARGAQIGGFSDILAIAGFDDPSRLVHVVAAWDNLIAAIGPDLVVADFSPLLCLAAAGGDTPVVLLGDGFTLPPVDQPLPAYRDIEPRFGEEHVLRVMNEVQAGRGRPPLPRVAALLETACRFVVTLPELDPFAAARGESAIGPIEPLPPPARDRPSQAWYAYLSLAHPQTATVLKALAASREPGSVYLRDGGVAQIKAARALGLTVHDEPQPLAAAFARAKVVIHHGGLGTAQVAMASGRVQLVVPRQLEQRLNSERLRALGLALAMGQTFEVDHVGQALRRALDDPALAERAQARAALIAGRGPPRGLARLVGACLGLAGVSVMPSTTAERRRGAGGRA